MGADGHGLRGIVELVGGAEVELGVVAVGEGGDGGVGAGEGEHARDGGVTVFGVDGHSLEDGADEVAARGGVLAVVGLVAGGLVPLDDEWRATVNV